LIAIGIITLYIVLSLLKLQASSSVGVNKLGDAYLKVRRPTELSNGTYISPSKLVSREYLGAQLIILNNNNSTSSNFTAPHFTIFPFTRV
jgi:hypothetical protein